MSEGSALSKGPDAFRTISEVAEELDLPQHVLRFWETRFSQIRPMKRGGGRRYYRPDDVELLRGIRKLLYGEGYTIKGVQRILKEQGARHVVAAGLGGALDPAPPGHRFEPEFDGDIPDGILVDEDHTPRGPAPQVGGYTDRRREPIFGGRSEPQAPPYRAPQMAPEPPRVAEPRNADFGPLPMSRIPAAPPEEPDEADVYLPPQAAHPARPVEPRRSEPPRQPPYEGALRGFAPPLEDDDAPVAARPAPMPAPTAPPEPALSGSDIERLQAALVELLECKRILDQAR